MWLYFLLLILFAALHGVRAYRNSNHFATCMRQAAALRRWTNEGGAR